MKRNLLVLTLIVALVLSLASCGNSAPPAESDSRTVTDMAGRTVEIPSTVNSIYATGSIGTIMLYTLAPDVLAGWNNELSDNEKYYIKEEYQDYPNMGVWKGIKYTGNIEEFLGNRPDIIVNLGDVSEAYISDSEAIEEQTGIPVLMVDGAIEQTGNAYAFLGDVLGREDRAKELADYFRVTMQSVEDAIGDLPESQRKSIYYAEGPKGLETEIQGTINSEILDVAGGLNIAVGEPGGPRRIQVSLETILLKDPEVIIISTDGDENHQVYRHILTSSSWSPITAVQEDQVYEIPGIPYDWINRPPSINRIIGIKWLTNLLYPDLYPLDIDAETKAFFELYYSMETDDSDLDAILVNATPKTKIAL